MKNAEVDVKGLESCFVMIDCMQCRAHTETKNNSAGNKRLR